MERTINIPIPMVLLCHACHTTMSFRHHDTGPFYFRASSLSFVVARVLCFVLHNFVTLPSIIFLRACTHCRMFSQQLWFFCGAFIIDQFHQYNYCTCLYNTLLNVKEVIFVWQAWMHKSQMEDSFLVPFPNCQMHNFVWILCAYMEMSLSFLLHCYLH